MLDDRDPYVVRDAAFQQWRNQFPVSSPIVGLRLKFRWPWSHQNQGPDLREFRVYFLDNPINARTGRATSVSAVSGQPTLSLVTLDLDLQDSTSANAYQGASLQAGNRAFPRGRFNSGGSMRGPHSSCIWMWKSLNRVSMAISSSPLMWNGFATSATSLASIPIARRNLNTLIAK